MRRGAELATPAVVQGGDLDVVHDDAAGIGHEGAREQMQPGRLAGSARSDHGHTLPGVHDEIVHLEAEVAAPVGEREVLDRDHRRILRSPQARRKAGRGP